MKSNNERYYKFQMTFPIESNKIYKSKSLNTVVKKCYDEFKNFSDIGEGLFGITNLDRNIEYRFKVKNKQIEKINDHIGGNQQSKLNEEVKVIIDFDDEKDNQYKEITVQKKEPPKEKTVVEIKVPQFDQLNQKLDNTNQNITKSTTEENKKLDDINQNVKKINEEILKNSKTITEKMSESTKTLNQIAQNTERKDLFDDIGDMNVFETKLTELYALQRLRYIDELSGKNENECVIL